MQHQVKTVGLDLHIIYGNNPYSIQFKEPFLSHIGAIYGGNLDLQKVVHGSDDVKMAITVIAIVPDGQA